MTIIRDPDTGEVVGRICQCRQGYYGVETTPPTLGCVMVTSILPTKRQAQNELYVEILKNQKGADNG